MGEEEGNNVEEAKTEREKLYIDNDLTEKEREVQRELREIAKTMRAEGKQDITYH